MTSSGRQQDVDVLIEIPIVFEVDGGATVHSPMVRASVGGVETRLILDTGSTDHVLTKELIDRVGAPIVPGEDGTDHAGALVPSWPVGDLDATIGGRPFGLHGVVAIDGPPQFAAWGVGGFLSPQHLHPTARVMIDLLNERLVLVEASGADADDWLIARVPTLRPLMLERVARSATVDVHAAVEPFGTVATILNTGGRQTEFASAVIPGSHAVVDGQGTGLSGTRVIGADVGARTLRVGDDRIPISHWSCATRWTIRPGSSAWTSFAGPLSSLAPISSAASCGWCPERTVRPIRTPYPVRRDHRGRAHSMRRPWTSEGSWNARGEAIMTPSPSSPARPSCGWTRPPA